MTRRETIGSASTRPRAARRSTRSVPSGRARSRICCRACSTVSTELVYWIGHASSGLTSSQSATERVVAAGHGRGEARAPMPCSIIRLVRAGVRQVQDRAEAREEPPAREHEEPEESRRDPELAPAERQPGAGADRGEHDQYALEEDRDETEHGDDHQRRVALRWTAGETLEQIAEGDQPADDEDEPRHRHP